MFERVSRNNPEKFGKYNEVFPLGKINSADPEYIQESEKCGGLPAYRKWGCAIDLVKKYQPSDPTNPQKPFLKDLKLEIAELLKLESDKDLDRVRVYTAVNSILDIDFGVDALVEFEDDEGKTRMVTFDITLNQAKIKGDLAANADIVIDNIPDIITEKSKYFEKLSELAEETAKILKTRKPEERIYD